MLVEPVALKQKAGKLFAKRFSGSGGRQEISYED